VVLFVIDGKIVGLRKMKAVRFRGKTRTLPSDLVVNKVDQLDQKEDLLPPLRIVLIV